jgi:oligopeptide transport system permease protein
MAMNENYKSIPKEKFEFANMGDKLHDQKFEDKPIGYFKDAWIRFRKNKASIVAAGIIILIVLFSIFMPLFNSNYDSTFLDPYYAKKGPKNVWLGENFGIMDAEVSRKASERGLWWLAATGVGAEDTIESLASGKKNTIADGMKSYYSPLNNYASAGLGPDMKPRFSVGVDTYLEVGFIYKEVTQQEYANIVAWQEANNIQVLYPKIEKNEYYYPSHITTDAPANYWYKTNAKGDPVTSITYDENGKATEHKIAFSEDAVLVDNYKRDENGNLVYWDYVGGGTHETAQYEIRVLYYNYYIYQNGFEPNYLFGTDSQGYDLALRMADGIRLSLLVSVCVCAINFFIGAIWGAVAGYYGGATDLIMERITDILAGVPSIVVMTLFQMHLAHKVGVIPSLLFAFVLTGWIGMSSRVRTQFYRFKNQEYVMAARTLGARDKRIIWKHIFPNTLGTIITGSVLAIPGVIFTESMLSFLGIVNLGGQETTSLGTLLSDASSIWTNYPHLMLFPALIIALLMISFNLFGNGLRDAFNPSLRGVED